MENRVDGSLSDLPNGRLFLTENGDDVLMTNGSGKSELIIRKKGKEIRVGLTKNQFNNLQSAKEKGAVEIEKKYLINSLPKGGVNHFPQSQIDQGYVVIGEKDELRIRMKNRDGNKKYYLTIKSGTGSIRGEIETTISQEQFELLWGEIEGNPIRKIRFEIPYKENTLELDTYLGAFLGKATVEAEFHDKALFEAFIAPEWCGPDVTNDKRLKNKNIALNGFPEDVFSGKLMREVHEAVKEIIETNYRYSHIV